MAPSATPNIQLLTAWNHPDQDALAKLTPLVYKELQRLAHSSLAGERRGRVLQTTALVNEAFLRLIDWRQVEWQNLTLHKGNLRRKVALPSYVGELMLSRAVKRA